MPPSTDHRPSASVADSLVVAIAAHFFKYELYMEKPREDFEGSAT